MFVNIQKIGKKEQNIAQILHTWYAKAFRPKLSNKNTEKHKEGNKKTTKNPNLNLKTKQTMLRLRDHSNAKCC